jgi:hypothetical protein
MQTLIDALLVSNLITEGQAQKAEADKRAALAKKYNLEKDNPSK